MGVGGGVLKSYPSQRQAILELLDAGDEMARAFTPGFSNPDCHCDCCTARRDWLELRKRHERAVDRVVNR